MLTVVVVAVLEAVAVLGGRDFVRCGFAIYMA
jgi:hypothetical protein